MRIEFDPAKDAANLAKHGVSLALAPKTSICYCVAFVERGAVRRPISLRRANRREVKRYVQSV